MITREEVDRLREELVRVLDEDAHNTQRLVARLEAISHETGVGAHAAMILILTQLAFDEAEARRHWAKIVEHRDRLARALGREVAVRVAVLDYFVHVNRKLLQPTLIELGMVESETSDATVDQLTGLSNDRVFRGALQSELRRARRYRQPASVVLFDVDEFGRANERFGRLVADRLLREAAIQLKNKTRDIDVAARPGEDEMALLLPQTDRNGALLVAERFRAAFVQFFAGREAAGQPVGLTVSGGVASYPEDATTAVQLLERAAQALYHAKAMGRNVIQVYRPERRHYLRFELESGRFELEVLAPPLAGAGDVRNLSRNGILFLSPEPLDVGESIEIRLSEEPAGPQGSRRIRGVVVRLEQLPEPAPAAAAADGDAEYTEDRYEIGVALQFGRDEESGDLSTFLESLQARQLVRRS